MDDWKWHDVGTWEREKVEFLGKAAREMVHEVGACLVVYEPGDMTRYEVLFTRVASMLLPDDETMTVGPKIYAAIVNMGAVYVLGDGWKSYDYVDEHWSGRVRLGSESAKALANLFNAFCDQLT